MTKNLYDIRQYFIFFVCFLFTLAHGKYYLSLIRKRNKSQEAKKINDHIQILKVLD